MHREHKYTHLTGVAEIVITCDKCEARQEYSTHCPTNAREYFQMHGWKIEPTTDNPELNEYHTTCPECIGEEECLCFDGCLGCQF